MEFKSQSIESNRNLLEPLKQMDALVRKLLLVVDKDQFKRLLTVGDFLLFEKHSTGKQ
jgi:hypothetical protein